MINLVTYVFPKSFGTSTYSKQLWDTHLEQSDVKGGLLTSCGCYNCSAEKHWGVKPIGIEGVK